MKYLIRTITNLNELTRKNRLRINRNLNKSTRTVKSRILTNFIELTRKDIRVSPRLNPSQSEYNAFTLIEILIISMLLIVVISFSVYFYGQLSRGGFSLEEGASFVVSVLNLAKQKAIVGEENANWGVWLKNNTNAPDYIHLYQNTTSTIKESFELPGGLSFFDFTDKAILFLKTTGATSLTTIKIGLTSGSDFRYIKVPPFGAITIDTQDTQPGSDDNIIEGGTPIDP